MDRRTLLERLDSARPDSDDLSLPDLAAAGEALVRDGNLSAEFHRRQEWDRRIAVVMHDVPVPPGLKARLLSKIDSESVHTAPTSIRPNRRRLLVVVSAVAASLMAVGLFWAVAGGSERPLAATDLNRAAMALLEKPNDAVLFDGNFAPQLPSANWHRVSFLRNVVGVLPDDDGIHRAAAWRFSFGRQRGVLIAVPLDDVANPPTGQREYVGGSAVAWTEGDFVYVCRVEGSIDNLLRQLDDARFA